jgi:Formin Homology 2 Domain
VPTAIFSPSHPFSREFGKFDSTQLKALKEYLPDTDERSGLTAYMKKGESSIESQQQLYADLSETEKYMVTLMDVPNVASKLEALLFRSLFSSRFQDVADAVSVLNAACDELRSSDRLRKLMAMILTVVNQINTGGEGNVAMGFTLDALLKLNEVSIFYVEKSAFSLPLTDFPLCRQKHLTEKLVCCTTS